MGDQVISYSLISAVRRGNLEKVRELISSFGLSYSQAGYVLLRDAVENKHTEVSKLLLTNGSKVNSKNKKPSNTPLHFAVINGDIEIVAMLLNRGANIDAKNQYGKTPYHNAVESKNMEIIELFLNRAADVNAGNSNSITPLHLAVEKAEKGYLQIVEHLLKHGAHVNSAYTSTCREGYTPLHLAVEKAERGYLQIVEHLLKHGAHVNSAYTSTCREGYTPLHLAVEKGSEEIIKLLLSRGANVDAKGKKKGITSLHIAAERGYLQIVEHLLKHGAHVNSAYTSTCREGYTPLHLAVEKNREEITKLLLSKDAIVDAKGKDGITSLHIAAKRGYLQIVQHLLKHGAHANSAYTSTCWEGYTPLHLAVERAKKGYLQMVEDLLKHGAHVNSAYTSTCWEGYTPLHLAVVEGSEEITKLLLSRGANVDAKGKNGITSLHIAAKRKYLQIVIALLEHGSDINITSQRNHTSLDFAMSDSLLYNKVNSYDSDDDYCALGRGSYNKVIAEILKHIVKIKTANLYVSGHNLLSIDSNYEIRDFLYKCEKEMASMRSEKIGNSNTSFYDILTKSINQLAILLENKNIVQILRSDDYKIKFPIYASMIDSRFRRGKRRKELLEQVNKNCYSIFPEMPYNCTQKVLSYLSDEDLRILIDVCQPTDVSSSDTNIDDVVL